MTQAPLVADERPPDVLSGHAGLLHRVVRAVSGPTGMTEVDKRKILQTLRARGLYARADWVDRQLPERVDLEKNAGLLATLRISPSELTDLPP
jgi:hypothetical protein